MDAIHRALPGDRVRLGGRVEDHSEDRSLGRADREGHAGHAGRLEGREGHEGRADRGLAGPSGREGGQDSLGCER